MHISIQIIIAALSVLGFYFFLKTIASLIFTSKHIASAVIIDSKKDLKELDLLLGEAKGALFAVRHRRIAVFIHSEVWQLCDEGDKALAKQMLCDEGAELYVI